LAIFGLRVVGGSGQVPRKTFGLERIVTGIQALRNSGASRPLSRPAEGSRSSDTAVGKGPPEKGPGALRPFPAGASLAQNVDSFEQNC